MRGVTAHLDKNEIELRMMLTDLKEVEDNELKNWNKMLRFEKIGQVRKEQGFDVEEMRNVTAGYDKVF